MYSSLTQLQMFCGWQSRTETNLVVVRDVMNVWVG